MYRLTVQLPMRIPENRKRHCMHTTMRYSYFTICCVTLQNCERFVQIVLQDRVVLIVLYTHTKVASTSNYVKHNTTTKSKQYILMSLLVGTCKDEKRVTNCNSVENRADIHQQHNHARPYYNYDFDWYLNNRIIVIIPFLMNSTKVQNPRCMLVINVFAY